MADAGERFNRVFTKVQNALPKCIKNDTIEPIVSIFASKSAEATRTTVEVAVRDYVVTKVCNGNDTDLSTLHTVTKLTIEMFRRDLCPPTLPVFVLSDAFDTLTISLCEQLFSFVEENVAVWKEESFFSPCKTNVLRMCNDLLRRLSRSQNTVFCGRILLFLARFFPFSERSGLNLISEFNLENITSYSNTESEEDTDTIQESDDSKSSVGTTKTKLDYNVYTKFWALQDFFRSPPQCFHKAPWKMFTTYANDILETFGSFKLDSVQRSSTGSSKFHRSVSEISNPDAMETNGQPQVDQYFAKYLTNKKLLDLQFSDANFRRYVLLQMLILAQYLTSHVKFKQESLSEDQLVWVKGMVERVYGLLAETPPDGPAFVKTVKHILKREEKWNEWKNDGCPEFKKPVGANAAPVHNGKETTVDDGENKMSVRRGRKRRVCDLIREADIKKRYIMGNSDMTKLWNLCPNNLAACRVNERDFVPTLEAYFASAIDQTFAKTEIKESDRIVNDCNFGWRALRLLACRSPHFFTHSQNAISTLPDYLTTMVKKIAKEVPSQLSEDVKVDEEEEEKEEKVIPVLEQAVAVKEEEEEMEEEDSGGQERPEIRPLNAEEQAAIAANLAKIGNDAWKLLAKKLSFAPDEILYMSEKPTEEEQAAFLLQLWVENEREDANKEELLYKLEGLKMAHVAEGVFT
ncbi:THO complex 1-like protein Hpr1 [Oratosquilla oratoria]|uniref:THO complex 1-like protein Hpr1 n=1 Tax=Oratosquilla oratoria TaxID=337810 RepID=UPI003F759A59